MIQMINVKIQNNQNSQQYNIAKNKTNLNKVSKISKASKTAQISRCNGNQLPKIIYLKARFKTDTAG